MIRGLMSIVLVIVSAGAALGQASVPNTPAGHMLTAWLDAFNSGDRARMDTFLKSCAPRLADGAMMSAQFRGQSGGLNLEAITRNERYRLAFRVNDKLNARVLLGRIEVSAAKSPIVENFTLRAVPAGAVLEDIRLDSTLRKQIIEELVSRLNEFYVYPALAEKMAGDLRAREKKGDYNAIADGDDFAALLTTQMVEVSHDKHLTVFYNPYKVTAEPAQLSFDQLAEDRKAMARDCGFRKLEILPNNIGFLKLDFFPDPMACGHTAAAAISFLANTDAVIIDLRENRGGDLRMVAMVCTYFFDRPVHLSDFYDRNGNKTDEYWTLRYVPGVRLGRKPAYVLTSPRTFSGGEELAYDLKNLKRATIVGEATAGGSHPVGPHPAGEHFVFYVPSAYGVSPVTGKDWEGTGVSPDVAARADEALETATRLAEQTIQQNPKREADAGSH